MLKNEMESYIRIRGRGLKNLTYPYMGVGEVKNLKNHPYVINGWPLITYTRAYWMRFRVVLYNLKRYLEVLLNKILVCIQFMGKYWLSGSCRHGITGQLSMARFVTTPGSAMYQVWRVNPSYLLWSAKIVLRKNKFLGCLALLL